MAVSSFQSSTIFGDNRYQEHFTVNCTKSQYSTIKSVRKLMNTLLLCIFELRVLCSQTYVNDFIKMCLHKYGLSIQLRCLCLSSSLLLARLSPWGPLEHYIELCVWGGGLGETDPPNFNLFFLYRLIYSRYV